MNTSKKTFEDMKTSFMEKFKNYSELVRAHQIREEDHAKMLSMQKELHSMASDETSDENGDQWKIATIVLASILGLILILFIWRRFKSKPSKRSEKIFKDLNNHTDPYRI